MEKNTKLVLSGKLDSTYNRIQHEEFKIINLVKRLFKNKRREKLRKYDK